MERQWSRAVPALKKMICSFFEKYDIHIDFVTYISKNNIFFQYCPVKNSRFFTSFRMTDYYILFVRDGVGWRRSRQPTPSPKHKTLIVISNEVRNLSQSFIYKVYQAILIFFLANGFSS